MALSDQEELELLTLERQKAQTQPSEIAQQIANDPISMAAKKDLNTDPAQRAFGTALKAAIIGPMKVMQVGNAALDMLANKAGGKVTDIAANAGASPEFAAGLGTVANAGVQAVPMVAGGEVAKLLTPAMRGEALNLMQSALKPGMKSLRMDMGAAPAQTMLDEGINVSRGGAEKVRARIDDLNNQITQALASSGATVDKNAVAARLQDVVGRIERTNPTPQDALKDVEKVYTQFMQNGLVPQNIPVQQAQEMKKGIYQMLRDKYGQLGSDTVEAQKGLARGFKEEIGGAVPQVRALNAEESKYLEVLPFLERRVLTEANRNPAGLSLIAHNPGAFAMFMADKSSLFKSLIARMMNSGSGIIPPNVARAGIGAATIDNNQQK